MRPDIINRIKEGSIKAYYNTKVTKITSNSVYISTKEGDAILENDFVLALTGYKPNFSFLESLGVVLSNDKNKIPSYDEATMETNVSGLFLAGVICGGMETHKWFIENSRIHAKKIMRTISDKKVSI